MILTCPKCGHDHLAVGSFCDACGAEMPNETAWCSEHPDARTTTYRAGTACTPEPPARHPVSARFHAILRELGELHDQRQRGYGTPTDPLHNVRASTEWGLPAWVGCMLRATDKVRRLQAVARGSVLDDEKVVDLFNDLAVYSVLGRILYEEASP